MTNWYEEAWKVTDKNIDRAIQIGSRYGKIFGYSGRENVLEELCDLIEEIEEENKHAGWERDLND